MREKLTSAISWKNHEKAKGVNCTRIASYPVTATESMAQSGDVGHLQAQTQKISNKGRGGGVKILIQKALKLFLYPFLLPYIFSNKTKYQYH